MFKFGSNYTPVKAYKRVFIDSVDENIKEEDQPAEAAGDSSRRLHLLNIKILSEQK